MLSMGPREHVLCVGTSVEPVSAPRFRQKLDLRLRPCHTVVTHGSHTVVTRWSHGSHMGEQMWSLIQSENKAVPLLHVVTALRDCVRTFSFLHILWVTARQRALASQLALGSFVVVARVYGSFCETNGLDPRDRSSRDRVRSTPADRLRTRGLPDHRASGIGGTQHMSLSAADQLALPDSSVSALLCTHSACQ